MGMQQETGKRMYCTKSLAGLAFKTQLVRPIRSPCRHPGGSKTQINRPWTGIKCAPSWNPQNVPDPVVMPCVEFSPQECVESQLKAIQANDEPWPNHGIQTMYAFAEDAGGMERSRYFGFSKDLYHFDHFLGRKTRANFKSSATLHRILKLDTQNWGCNSRVWLPGGFSTAFPELLNLSSYTISGQEDLQEDAVGVMVAVKPGGGLDATVEFMFTVVMRRIGRKKGCWMTKRISKLS